VIDADVDADVDVDVDVDADVDADVLGAKQRGGGDRRRPSSIPCKNAFNSM
jgi:hypothetical protein